MSHCFYFCSFDNDWTHQIDIHQIISSYLNQEDPQQGLIQKFKAASNIGQKVHCP